MMPLMRAKKGREREERVALLSSPGGRSIARSVGRTDGNPASAAFPASIRGRPTDRPRLLPARYNTYKTHITWRCGRKVLLFARERQAEPARSPSLIGSVCVSCYVFLYVVDLGIFHGNQAPSEARGVVIGGPEYVKSCHVFLIDAKMAGPIAMKLSGIDQGNSEHVLGQKN